MQRALQDGLFDHATPPKCCGPRGVRIVRRCPWNPDSSDRPSLVVGDERHRAAPRAAVTCPCSRRRASSCSPSGPPSRRSTVTSRPGETTVGYRVQLDHLAPVPVGDEVARRGRPRVRRGSPAHVPGVGEAPGRPRRRRPDHPGRGRAVPLPRQSRRQRPDPPVPSAAWATPGTRNRRPAPVPSRIPTSPAGRARPRPTHHRRPRHRADAAATARRAHSARRDTPASGCTAGDGPGLGTPRHPPRPARPRARPPAGADPGGPPPKKRRLTWLWILIPVLRVLVAATVVVVVFGVKLFIEPIDATNDFFADLSAGRYDEAYDQLCSPAQRAVHRSAVRRSARSEPSRRSGRITSTTSTASSSQRRRRDSDVIDATANGTVVRDGTTYDVDVGLEREDDEWKVCDFRRPLTASTRLSRGCSTAGRRPPGR